MIGRKLSWAVFGSALEWFGALATLALVYFQVNFVSVSEDYALEAQLMAIEEKIDVSCRAITSELLDLRDAALDRDSLTVYLSRRKAAEDSFGRDYPFVCDYTEYGAQQYPAWIEIGAYMAKVETWMIGATATLTIIGLLVKRQAKGQRNG